VYMKKQKIKIADTQPINCELGEMGKISLLQVQNYNDCLNKPWREMIEKYHYIGDGKVYGRQLRYILQSENYGYIGAMSYSSPAWKIRARDEWIGWESEKQEKNLDKVIGNSRFLILPNIRVLNLASHILSIAHKKIVADWEKKYTIKPVLIETFVEAERYTGNCYKAANYIYIGNTQGRGRQDEECKYGEPVKKIYMYALSENFRSKLEGIIREKKQPEDWAEEEFGAADFGDIRLTNRLIKMGRDFYKKPTANIPEACESRAKSKAVYRFLDNEEVNKESILESHYKALKQRIAKEKLILAAQDTTELNYSSHQSAEELGPINSIETSKGLLLHDTLLLNGEGTPLGILDAQIWARDKEEHGKSKDKTRELLPIEEKESNKWLESYLALKKLQEEYKKIKFVSICDREGDIYELFQTATASPTNPRLLVRAAHNRRLTDETGFLWDYMKKLPEAGNIEVIIPRQKNKKKRQVTLTVRHSKVKISVPQIKRKEDNKDIEIYAIYVCESGTANENEKIEWMLLTNEPIENFEKAAEVIKWYAARWNIEIYHKILKSGCKIENRQLAKGSRLEKIIAIDMIIAWRIFYLTKLGRETPNIPCDFFFEEYEWKALVAYVTKNSNPPLQQPTLGEAMRMVAQIGGFLGRKCDGNPGVITLWRGLEKLNALVEMWLILKNDSP